MSSTIEEVLRIVSGHVNFFTMARIVQDLQDVAGDKEFRKLIARLGKDYKVAER